MADPGYDFFATGAPAGTAEPAAAAPAVNRFGGPVEPEPEPAAPSAHAVAPAPAPAHEPAVAVSVPGYHPGEVNRFGSPAELAAVPTGPYAAPGLGTAPIEAPGLVSTWSGPAAASAAPVASTAAPVAPAAAPLAAPPASYAPPAPAAHTAPAAPAPSAYAEPAPLAYAAPAPTPVAVSRFGSPIPPDVLAEDPSYAALAFGTPAAGAAYGAPGYAPPAGHAHQPASSATPGAVKAAGIIGIVLGGLSLVLALFGLLGYLALRSQLSALSSSPELAGSGLTASSLIGFMLVGIVIIMLIGTGYVVAGVATVRGARWGAWTLLVVSAISVLYGVYEIATGGLDFGTLLSIAVSGTVVVLLGVSDSMAWLRRSEAHAVTLPPDLPHQAKPGWACTAQ